jgi:hypothetical protein
VTRLEPRTLHQPEKLKKLSKNDCLFTPSIFPVNEKSQPVTTCVFNRVQTIHRRMTGFGAEEQHIVFEKPRPARHLARNIDANQCESRAGSSAAACGKSRKSIAQHGICLVRCVMTILPT